MKSKITQRINKIIEDPKIPQNAEFFKRNPQNPSSSLQKMCQSIERNRPYTTLQGQSNSTHLKKRLIYAVLHQKLVYKSHKYSGLCQIMPNYHVKIGWRKNQSTIRKFPKMTAPDTYPPHHTFLGFFPEFPLPSTILRDISDPQGFRGSSGFF